MILYAFLVWQIYLFSLFYLYEILKLYTYISIHSADAYEVLSDSYKDLHLAAIFLLLTFMITYGFLIWYSHLFCKCL